MFLIVLLLFEYYLKSIALLRVCCGAVVCMSVACVCVRVLTCLAADSLVADSFDHHIVVVPADRVRTDRRCIELT